ncbi:LOW QUALITY PROTEIN: hypothetical protein Cgig2_008486 [Carnegiea gigantea]|uniref:SWIM-type domain-containing protein n=1 Tax=Carnegiea gigantea TaxID=171969 RepID=A0A9Q1QGB6_9CARY|nr:LOW QUALITY PROTEIN: hypothetical protein Cgig2_008486 [Carnegiea gigantea]
MDLVVHYKDKVIRIMDVEMEKYNCIELFRDATESAKESDVRSKCIPIYMYDMKKPSDNQKHVESLDQISASTAQSLSQIVAVESKKNVRLVSSVEDLTDSKHMGGQFDCEPYYCLVKPMAHRPVTRFVINSPIKPTPSSQSRPYKSPPQPKSTSLKKSCKYPAKLTFTSSPKPTTKASPLVELKVKGKSSYYLSISPSPSPQSKADCTPLPQTISYLKKPLLNPLESSRNPSKPDSNPKHPSKTPSKPNCNLGESIAAPTKPHTRSQSRDDSNPKKSSSNNSKCLPPFNPLPLAVLGVNELLDFDVVSLCREPQWEFEENEWDDGRDTVISIVGAQAEGGRIIVTSVDDNPPSDDDSEDEDFVVDGEDVDHSEDVSLDEENNSSDSGDEEQLEVQVEQKMQLRAEIIDNDADRDLVMNKMARSLRNKDGKGIIKALRTAIPPTSRRTCVIHYYKNFTSLYPSVWFHAFYYIAVNAYAPFVHEKGMEKIREKDPGAYYWLRDNEKLELWARLSLIPILNVMTIPTTLLKASTTGLPILTILEEIRKLIGTRLVPFVHKKLLIIEIESRNCIHLVHAVQGEFDVTEGHTNFIVRLQDTFCDCRKWQLTGLPCKHAARNLYNHIIHPIAAPQMQEKRNLPDLDPPYAQRKTGRPPEHKRR